MQKLFLTSKTKSATGATFQCSKSLSPGRSRRVVYLINIWHHRPTFVPFFLWNVSCSLSMKKSIASYTNGPEKPFTFCYSSKDQLLAFLWKVSLCDCNRALRFLKKRRKGWDRTFRIAKVWKSFQYPFQLLLKLLILVILNHESYLTIKLPFSSYWPECTLGSAVQCPSEVPG